MNDLVDSIFSDGLKRCPELGSAYQRDAMTHQQVESARLLLRLVVDVMRREGVDAECGERVLRGVVDSMVEGWSSDQAARDLTMMKIAGFLDVPIELLGGGAAK